MCFSVGSQNEAGMTELGKTGIISFFSSCLQIQFTLRMLL